MSEIEARTDVKAKRQTEIRSVHAGFNPLRSLTFTAISLWRCRYPVVHCTQSSDFRLAIGYLPLVKRNERI